MRTMKVFDKAKAAVLGSGYSKITRDPLPPGKDLGDEAVEACKAAIADAGLQIQDIDGLTANTDTLTHAADGVTGVSLQYMWRRLNNPVRWGEINLKFPGSALIEANNAIAGGACRYALVWHAADQAPKPGGRFGQPDTSLAPGGSQWTLPIGNAGGYMLHAPSAQRYFDRYGATREDLAYWAVINRKHALMNPVSYWSQNRQEKLTKEDYMSARMVADPLCLYDCDIPVRGVVAFVLGPAEAAKDIPHKPAYIKAFTQWWIGPRGPEAFRHNGGIMLKPTIEDNNELPPVFRRNLWEPSGLKPSDIQTANVYDGFTIMSWLWLEALGFCKEGEAYQFIKNGRMEIGGALPLNTGGGHLGEGAMAGTPHHSEAVRQVTGRAGERQVKNVRYALAATDRPTRASAIIYSSEID